MWNLGTMHGSWGGMTLAYLYQYYLKQFIVVKKNWWGKHDPFACNNLYISYASVSFTIEWLWFYYGIIWMMECMYDNSMDYWINVRMNDRFDDKKQVAKARMLLCLCN